jgi:hypothetical protein
MEGDCSNWRFLRQVREIHGYQTTAGGIDPLEGLHGLQLARLFAEPVIKYQCHLLIACFLNGPYNNEMVVEVSDGITTRLVDLLSFQLGRCPGLATSQI